MHNGSIRTMLQALTQMRRLSTPLKGYTYERGS